MGASGKLMKDDIFNEGWSMQWIVAWNIFPNVFIVNEWWDLMRPPLDQIPADLEEIVENCFVEEEPTRVVMVETKTTNLLNTS